MSYGLIELTEVEQRARQKIVQLDQVWILARSSLQSLLQKGLRLVELTSILVETGQPVRHPVCRPGVVHCDVKLSCTLEASLRLRRIPSLDGKGHSDGTGEQVSLWALTLITVGHERQHV